MQLIKLKEVEFEDVIALQPTSCIRRKGILDETINYFKKKYNSMFSGNIIKSLAIGRNTIKSLLLIIISKIGK